MVGRETTRTEETGVYFNTSAQTRDMDRRGGGERNETCGTKGKMKGGWQTKAHQKQTQQVRNKTSEHKQRADREQSSASSSQD